MSFPPVIFEEACLTRANPQEMDERWSKGWRHFGSRFFRYSLSLDEDGSYHRIQPLRMVLADFQLNPRHRRILKKNADLRLEIGPAQVNEARMRAIGKAEAEPVAPNDTAENRARNRRVDIILAPEQNVGPDTGAGVKK